MTHLKWESCAVKPPWFWWGHQEKMDAMFSHSKVNGSCANLRCLYIPLKMLWLTSPKNVKVDLNKFPETELFIPAFSEKLWYVNQFGNKDIFVS